MRIKIQCSKKNVLALVMAMVPFLKNYNVPLLGKNITVLLFLSITLAEIIKCLAGNRSWMPKNCTANTLLLVMAGYMTCSHVVLNLAGGTEFPFFSVLADIGLFAVELYGLMMLYADREIRKRYRIHLERITMAMSACIYVQYVLYYGFGMIPGGPGRQFFIPFPGLMTDSVQKSVSHGTMVIYGLFRPSAFFLEPAHFAHYSAIGLACMVFGSRKALNLKTAMVTGAIVLSTSGIGIAAVSLIWVIVFLYGAKSLSKNAVVRNFIIVILVPAVFLVFYLGVPFFQQTVNRMTGAGNAGDNALLGRLGNWERVRQLEGISKWFGMGYKNLPTFGTDNTYYFTGFLELCYCQGILGAFLFFAHYAGMFIQMFIQKNRLGMLILMIGGGFLVGSSILSPSSLAPYIPFLYLEKEKAAGIEKGLEYEKDFNSFYSCI